MRQLTLIYTPHKMENNTTDIPNGDGAENIHKHPTPNENHSVQEIFEPSTVTPIRQMRPTI